MLFTFRTPRFFFSLLTIAFLLAGPRFAPAAETMRQIKAVVTPYLSYGPYFIAQDEGYFAAQGLQVEFVRFTVSSQAIPALIQGDVDVTAGLLYPAYFNAMLKGADIKMVADRGSVEESDCSYAVVARTALVNHKVLDAPRGMRGLRFGVDNPGSPSFLLLDTLLKQQGLSLNDVEAVNLPTPARLDGLASGAVDVTIVKEPFVTRFTDSGHAKVWRLIGNLAPGYQDAAIFFGPNLLQKDRDTGQRFITAYLQGVRRFNRGKTERNVAILAKYTGLEKSELRIMCWPRVREDGLINVQSVLDLQDWLHSNRHLDGKVAKDTFWDPQFVDHAKKMLSK